MKPDRKEAARIARLARPDTYAEDRLGLKLHPKQAAVLRDLFRPNSRVAFRCANEVGKTTHIAAPAILYALDMLGAQAISTAGVWMQVESQLIPALQAYSSVFPDWRFLDSGIKINGVDRYIGFSTRNPGFAQGFHRRAGMPLLGIVDEAAAVEGVIIDGVEDRCNPDFFLVMGSPLQSAGRFYEIETKLASLYSHHRLNQMECLKEDGYWLERETIERKRNKWGEENPLFMSNVLGEFPGSVDGAVITLAEFEACLATPLDWLVRQNERHAFLDFAGGRAKNVFAVRIGNKVWIAKKWVDVNTMSACGEFLAIYQQLHKEFGLEAWEVEGDADGLGLPMIQRLQEMGFALNKFHGGGAPRYSDDYANAISEAWGEGAGRMKRKDMLVCNDLDFKAQAVSRKLKRNSTGKFQLEPKEDMAKRGLDSPDEADAIFGAMMPAPMVRGQQVMGNQPGPLSQNRETIWQQRDFRDQEESPCIPGAWAG